MARIACIACGHLMVEHSCKVKCPRCGVFYDCGDGMLPMPEGESVAEAEPRAR